MLKSSHARLTNFWGDSNGGQEGSLAASQAAQTPGGGEDCVAPVKAARNSVSGPPLEAWRGAGRRARGAGRGARGAGRGAQGVGRGAQGRGRTFS